MANDPRRAPTWADVPPTSGEQCARALRRAGLDVTMDGPDYVAVTRFGVPIVRIPLIDHLRAELVVAIAKTVNLTPEQFIAYLAE